METINEIQKIKIKASEIRKRWLKEKSEKTLEGRLEQIKKLTQCIKENDMALKKADENEFECTYWQVKGLKEQDSIKLEACAGIAATLAVFAATLSIANDLLKYDLFSKICLIADVVLLMIIVCYFLMNYKNTRERTYWRIRAMMMEEIRNNK